MRYGMTRYLISFDDGWMTFTEADLPAVACRCAQEVRVIMSDPGS
jgi:hypothetical protein